MLSFNLRKPSNAVLAECIFYDTLTHFYERLKVGSAINIDLRALEEKASEMTDEIEEKYNDLDKNIMNGGQLKTEDLREAKKRLIDKQKTNSSGYTKIDFDMSSLHTKPESDVNPEEVTVNYTNYN